MAAFVQVEEVERISMEPWERVERVVRDFFREGWVGEPVTTMSLVGLGEEVGFGDGQGGGGGGGGYSGEGSGKTLQDSCGGGGGSFSAGNNQHNDCCYNSAGHGQVTIILQ